jgi:hypothetical protein
LEDAAGRTTHEHDRLTEVEAALRSEITQSQRRLQDRQRLVYMALSDLICESPELAQLFQALDDAWGRIRGIRKAFDLISTALHGYMPTQLLSRWQASPPMDYHAIGFPLDETPALSWTTALERLLVDADTQLPK